MPIRWRVPPSHSTGPRFAEFFAGIGLVRMGLEAKGWSVAFANDIDPDKRAQYDHQFGDADEHFVLSDVHTIDGRDVPDVDLATASFPCTDLSLAGARAGLDRGPQSSAFWGFVEVLRSMGPRRPPLVLIENVVGFLTSHGGKDFHSAMRAMNDLGYSVDPFVLDAKWFVPQSRPRLFVVASTHADPTASRLVIESRLRPSLVRRFVTEHTSIDWRIRPLPDPPERSSTAFTEILDTLADSDPRWWSAERTAYLYNQFSERHRALADTLTAKRKWSYATVFRRVRLQADGSKRSMGELRFDGLAGCLRTPKGGSGRQILFKAGYNRHAARLLTPRECARLMGAPAYRITGQDNRAYFGFGDAVCVPAISWIAEHYLGPVLHQARCVGTSHTRSVGG